MPLTAALIPIWVRTAASLRTLLVTTALVWVASVVPPSVRADGKPAGSIVAVVNADPITRDQLAKSTLDRYGIETVDTMVNRYLIQQACQQRQIEVTNQDVSDEIRRLAQKFNLSMEAYLGLLEEERDISPNEYSREIIWPMLALRRLVAEEVEVTGEEINRAFLGQYGEAVKCRLIMVEKRDTALRLREQAAAQPASFAALAKQFSNDEMSASVGGLIPPIRRYNGDNKLEEAAFALADDEVSEILPLGDQWVILQAVRRIPATQPSPKALPMIRAQITDRIRDEKMKVAASKFFGRLQAEAKVVKVLGDSDLENQYPGAAAIINGQQVPINLVAQEAMQRHGATVLEGEINRKLLTKALQAANKQVLAEDMDKEIDKAAIAFGFIKTDGQPDVETWMATVLEQGKVTRDVYLADSVWPSVALTKLVEDDVEITEQDMRQGFESSYGPRVEVLAIVLSDQKSAQKVWQMARDNPTDGFFGSLAQQYSVEPVSASNNGKVPPIRKYGGQPAVEKEAFALKPGELSGIIATGGTYIILRCQGFTEPIVSDPAAVTTELRRDITEKKMRRAMAAKMESLRSSSQIDNFMEVAKKMPRVATRP